MKTKTNELHGVALNWAVTQCEGTPGQYSTDWALGGPIIEREDIGLEPMTIDDCDGWLASHCSAVSVRMEYGPTPLIAAMRCYVASKLGNEVDVPEFGNFQAEVSKQ